MAYLWVSGRATEDDFGRAVEISDVSGGAEADLEGVNRGNARRSESLGRILFSKTRREVIAVGDSCGTEDYTLRERRVNSPSQSKLRIEHG